MSRMEASKREVEELPFASARHSGPHLPFPCKRYSVAFPLGPFYRPSQNQFNETTLKMD